MNAFEWLRAWLLCRVPTRIAAEAAGLPLEYAGAERMRLALAGELGEEERARAEATLERRAEARRKMWTEPAARA